jgi:phosphatidate cytidylyltransferase
LFFTLAVSTPWFTAVVCGVAVVALWEFYSMVFTPKRSRVKLFAVAVGVPLVLVNAYFPQMIVPVAGLLFMGFALYFLWCYQDINTVISEVGLLTLGWVYIPILLSPLVLLHKLEHGSLWVLLVLIMTMMCDSCAYFVGTAFGKHRLYPAISPKKSIEGAIGGLLGSVLTALAAHLWLLPQSSWIDCLIVGILAGSIGQLGDLFESMIKRYANIKDSGTIFPGHGGMLDRIDSLLFSFPAVYAYLYFTSGTFH